MQPEYYVNIVMCAIKLKNDMNDPVSLTVYHFIRYELFIRLNVYCYTANVKGDFYKKK